MGKLFGTDGVRGIANRDLTPELACALGKAGVLVLRKTTVGRKPIVVIGKDTRISGDMIEAGLSAGILSMGGEILRAGVMPTPAIAYLVRAMGADCGVVISASHNLFEYNGIKFFNGQGFKLDDAIEAEIEKIIRSGKDPAASPIGAALGQSLEKTEDTIRLYTDHLISGMKTDISGMKIVVDCAHGAAVRSAQIVFSSLGAETVFIGNTPNGYNINDGYGSTHPEKLAEAVLREGADIGFAFDGDADRLIAADENGRILDGDILMYICAKQMKQEGKLAGNLLTATVMSNIGLKIALEQTGIQIQTTDVGDRYVLERMLATGSVLGGEQSGHIIFLDDNTTGDGLFAALRLLSAIRSHGVRVSEAADGIRIYPQILKNARVKNENKNRYMEDSEIRSAIEATEKSMHGEGRVLIRSSGTEPLVRVMIEGSDQRFIDEAAGELTALIERKLA
ncbi:MAG: phosphoglucosamine mutase [Clostridiales Family XIII bacterium]|jgi:phosphoglucosamine mutase|nr:phosphoglucosamine mutase [Clostridiales Family XIII bacterium]